MSWFFTADLHFDHANVIRHTDRRPWYNRDTDLDAEGKWRDAATAARCVEAMNAALVENWNSMVTAGDDVVIAGDFAWKRHGHWLQALRGRKHLLIGSHDRMPGEALRSFTSVTQILKRRFGQHMYIICHWPFRTWDMRSYGSRHLFGHVHGAYDDTVMPNSMDIGIDARQRYRPWPLEELDQVLTRSQEEQDQAQHHL